MRTFHKGFLIILATLCLSGCVDIWGQSEKVEDFGKKSEVTGQVLAESLAQADKLVTQLEGVTGARLPDETVGKMESFFTKANETLKKVDQVTSIAAAPPGPQQPYAVGVDGLVAGLIALTGGLGAFFANRRRKQAVAGLKTIVRATTNEPGIGKKILAASKDPAAQAAIKAAYNDVTGG